MKYKGWIAAGLVLGLLGLCALIGGVLLFTFRQVSTSGVVLPLSRGLNFSAEAQEERSFDVTAPVKLTVQNELAGAVRVQAGASGAVVVSMKKTANGVSQAEAQKNLERLTVDIAQTGSTLEIKVKAPQGGLWSGAVEFDITVPEETAVNVSSDAGELKLVGTHGEASLATTYGAVTVTNLDGGPLVVRTQNGRIEASGIKVNENAIELRSQFGDVLLKNAAAGAVTLKSDNGALSLNDMHASGKVSLASDFGRIEFHTGRAGSLEVQAQNGAIDLRDVDNTGSLVASSSFGAIDLQRVGASGYDLKTQNGAIHLDQAAGSIKARSDFGDVEVTGAQDATLDLRSGNGGVLFEGSLGQGPHELHSEYGAIRLRLPSASAFNFDLKTSFGKIHSDFEITLQGDMDENHWQGKVNGGGDLLTASTQNGDIDLKTR